MKIVIATGGTGGHIFPALQTGCVLRERGHEVFFVGTLGKAEEKIKTQGFSVILINAKGLTDRSFLGFLDFGGVMLQAIGQANKVLKEIRPDKVIGFGGYGSFAVVLSAKFLNIPLMIHEQNVVLGKANKLLSKVVKKVAISFPQTKEYMRSLKTVWTGCPCHQDRPVVSREALLKKFSLDSNRQTILLLGGSQGSQKLNEVFFELISSRELSGSVQAIHMTGIKDYSLYVDRYQNSSFPVKVLGFISPIEEAYAVSDVVITRAGAATVSELGFFGIPSVFVPYPLADGHQKYNADVLAKLGIAQIIEQKDLSKNSLKQAIERQLNFKLDKEKYYINMKEYFKEKPAYELALAVENL